PTADSLDAFCGQINTAWATAMPAMQSAAQSYQGCAATDLSGPTGVEAVVADAIPGTRTGTTLPASTAMVMHETVQFKYRGGHPRTYLLVGVADDKANDSQWASTFLTSVITQWNIFLGTITGFANGGTTYNRQVIVSYYGGAPTVGGKSQLRVTPLVFPVLGITPRNAIGTIRRRLHF
ncbi:MAG: hypothetical protein JO244_10785, partial [Solirubrobacterales bacterium]|nr:hypothetical protein [Solirubrobacterales bacterium]